MQPIRMISWLPKDHYTFSSRRVHHVHRIPGAVCIRTEVVIFLRQRVNAGEDAVGGLEAFWDSFPV